MKVKANKNIHSATSSHILKVGLTANSTGHTRSNKIVVVGPSEAEVTGIIALLQHDGFQVCQGKGVKLDADDLLIVTLSTVPLLGWWRHLEYLHMLKRKGKYQMLAIIPTALKEIMLRQSICPIIEGGGTLAQLHNALLAAAETWKKGILPRINRGKSTPDRKLTAGQARAIYKLLEGKYIDSKTQYSQRYLALERLGFSGTAQFSLFTAGIGNVIQRQNFIF
ncbi:hypothetical protein POJ30_004363 [Salmonella enterica]|uniref:hypothetical protein n=1 Tax=Salmonella enterica TaxID=28901 RepID=UPI0009B11D0C|nr:hypothetical protein [Salmonella enterica]ECI0840128.1 hypothetical protein [Salmonella enterica subsp. diarizonae]EKK6333432.1 hypothetical protein [Salmonella enterica]WGI49593.1 hypothetical protein QBX66_24370 [Salmonella enterica subsp. diarizonae serovar 48:i:z]